MSEIPSDGIEGLKENWKGDLMSGFLIFLIALPLSLGIALASGVPPLSGIIAAVVGGLVVSMTSGSYVTINGPAAGLIVVILGAVNSMGGGIEGYRLALAAITIAGILQVIAGVTKAGKLSTFFPSSAVHGLLASIGIIIIAKQSYFMFGIKPVGKTAIQQLANLPASLGSANPELAFIGLITMAILIVMPRLKPFKRFPAPLVGVVVGMCLATYFDLSHEHTYLAFQNHEYKLGPDALVTLPGNLAEGIVHPDWSRMGDPVFWKAVMMIFIIASLETLLSAAAVDKLDPFHRKADLNRDLTAVGIGTAVSGWLGGLPMIAEIVRSSANINNGAKTRWSNFFHGLFMLIFVAFASGMIHRIPIASLAAILVFTGFRLASPKEFKKTWEIGSDQMLIFVTTIVVTLGTDLLIGIMSGVLVKLALHIIRGNSPGQLLKCNMDVQVDENQAHCNLNGAVAFTNLIFVKQKLEAVPTGLDVKIDLSQTRLVDHSAMEFLEHFQHDYERTGGHVSLVGLEGHRSASAHPLAARTK
ncbi:MAG: SulP family inorganic anion transporter [Vulcanimicrobiota bacterium]